MIQEETKRNEISLTGYSTDTKLRYIASQVLQTVFDNSRFSSVGVQENEINDLMGARDYFSFFLFSLDLFLFMAMKATLGARGCFFVAKLRLCSFATKKKKTLWHPG